MRYIVLLAISGLISCNTDEPELPQTRANSEPETESSVKVKDWEKQEIYIEIN
jgi:hypothetical protein